MVTQSSTCFAAKLPDSLTDQQLEKLVNWAHQTCIRSDVTMTRDGHMQLVAEAKKTKTAREFQRNLRTCLNNWGVVLPQQMSGWLQLITREQYPEMITPPGRRSAAAQEPHPESAYVDVSDTESWVTLPPKSPRATKIVETPQKKTS